MGLRVWGLGLRVWGLGCRVYRERRLGLLAPPLGSKVSGGAGLLRHARRQRDLRRLRCGHLVQCRI